MGKWFSCQRANTAIKFGNKAKRKQPTPSPQLCSGSQPQTQEAASRDRTAAAAHRICSSPLHYNSLEPRGVPSGAGTPQARADHLRESFSHTLRWPLAGWQGKAVPLPKARLSAVCSKCSSLKAWFLVLIKFCPLQHTTDHK